MEDGLVIVGGKDPVLADFASHCLQRARRSISIFASAKLRGKLNPAVIFHPVEEVKSTDRLGSEECRDLVVFLDHQLVARSSGVLTALAELVQGGNVRTVCVISTFRVYLGDQTAARIESEFLRRLKDTKARLVVIRPGHVLSPNSRVSIFLARTWYCFPFIPNRLRSCAIEGEDLFSTIDRELAATGKGEHVYALLGSNRAWRQRLLDKGGVRETRLRSIWTVVCLPLLFLGWLLGLGIRALARTSARVRAWHFDTLRPQSLSELVSLYNKYNQRYIKVVGYNNGVVHFGHQYPDKTVVSTVKCNRRATLGGSIATFDAGVTIRQAMDVLGKADRELPVLPNYSYVSLGTAYFIPIHGSANKHTTISETIEKVVLYDAAKEKVLVARRQDATFGHYLYNLAENVLLLRLHIQTNEKLKYHVKQIQATDISSQEVWDHFHAVGPSNVELRKAGSATNQVTISQYYVGGASGEDGALAVPRDKIGRLWDRLEENPISSVLFHGLTRWLGYHVELFLSESEFATFWDTHRGVPILKIQLRFIRRDGFPNSPFRDHDCIAADLFMRKKDRPVFDSYLKNSLPGVKMNPGKHSM